MDQKPIFNEFRLETPATYRIRVQGYLDESWADRLGGMSISPFNTADNRSLTILVGHLIDQAALLGVLNALYDMRMPLLSVENLDEKRKAES